MDIINLITSFFNSPIFNVLGGITFIITSLGIIYRITCISLGISPLVYKIGKAIWRRKIAIIGDAEAFGKLQRVIKESNIFNTKNIIHIPVKEIEKVKIHTILLVDWESSMAKINEIFDFRKTHNSAVIIFASAGTIDKDIMIEIANKSNTVVVNFRGRLLNDILNALLTTSFDER